MNKLYLPVTIGLALYAAIIGNNDFSTFTQQALAIGFVFYRPQILPRVQASVRFATPGTWAIVSILSVFILFAVAYMPMAPGFNETNPNSIFITLLLCAAAIYIPLVFITGFIWVRKTIKAADDGQVTDAVEDSYPNARGWATAWEIASRFKLPMEGELTTQNLTGIHIGNAIHWNELGHILTVGGAGMGKGQCLVLPALLSDGLVRAGTSVVCLDPKGENAAVCARHLEKSGYEVHIINPFDISGLKKFKKARWHPFGLVNDTEKNFADMLAFSLHNRTSKGDGEFFNTRARQYISLYVRYALHLNRHRYAPNPTPLITQIHDMLLLSGEKRENLLSQMATDPTFAGKANAESILSRLMSASIKTEEGIYTTIEGAIDILADERIQASMSQCDFDMRELAFKPMAVFICIPHDMLRDYAPWIRIFTDLLLNTLNKHWNPKRKVLVLLDEFAQLGYVHQFSFAPAILRGYNITLWPVIQYIGQLIDLYGKDQFETFVANSVVKQWFGGNGTTMDNTTAEYIAARMPMTVDIITNPDGTKVGKERPLLTKNQIIAYPGIIGEVAGLPAPMEIAKISYKNWHFCKNNADDNPMY